MIMALPPLKLPTPPHMPCIGLGTWKSAPGVVTHIVSAALKLGYRSLDCACDYGNEKEVGLGISSAISEGLVSRDDLFITSKLWNTYHAKEHVRQACLRTLSDLQLDYLDLYMIHFPISLQYVPIESRYPPEWLTDPDVPKSMIEKRVPLSETWQALEQLVDDGLVKHLGICNFPVALLMDLLSYARIRPAVLQVELHPYLQQDKLLHFCKLEGIAVTAFSPLGSGSYVSLEMDKGDRVLQDPVLKTIAQKHGKTTAQVALRWGIQRNCAVIPKTEHEDRLAENLALDFELSDQDMAEIAQLDKGRRYNNPGEFCIGMGKTIPIYD